MATDLEAELKSAVRNGFLHLNLSRSWNGKVWITTYRTTESTTIHEVTDPDPVESMKKALRAGGREAKKPKRNMGDLI